MGRVATVDISASSVALEGALVVPPRARGIVVFAHGSGSGRFSPRNRAVARTLNAASLATLLIDLLTADEEEADLRTASCALTSASWASASSPPSTGSPWMPRSAICPPPSGACPWAASGPAPARPPRYRRRPAPSEWPRSSRAVAGRIWPASEKLARVTAPTLLIVGGRDTDVLRLNRVAQQRLGGESRLEIVPGAGHLFEEPGALDRVAALARDWFVAHLVS